MRGPSAEDPLHTIDAELGDLTSTAPSQLAELIRDVDVIAFTAGRSAT